MTFWDHLDVLRGSIIRMLVAAGVMGVGAFLLKEPLFEVVLAPSRSDFFVYRWMGAEPFTLQLVNTALTEQFMVHLKVALAVGVLVASPYIVYLLFRFVGPALSENLGWRQRGTHGSPGWCVRWFPDDYAVAFPR